MLPKDLGNLRIINRNRDHLVAGVLHIARNVICRLAAVGLGFDSEYGNAFCSLQELRYLRVRSE